MQEHTTLVENAQSRPEHQNLDSGKLWPGQAGIPASGGSKEEKFIKRKQAQVLFPGLCRAPNPGTRRQAVLAAELFHMLFGKRPRTMNPI